MPGYPDKPDPWPFEGVPPGIFILTGILSHSGGTVETIKNPMIWNTSEPAYTGWWQMNTHRFLYLVYGQTPFGWELGGATSPFIGFLFPPIFTRTLPDLFTANPWYAHFHLTINDPLGNITVDAELRLPRQLSAGPTTPSLGG